MKKIFLIAIIASIFASCKQNSTWNEETEAKVKKQIVDDIVASGQNEKLAVPLSDCIVEKLKAAKLSPEECIKEENKEMTQKLVIECAVSLMKKQ